MSNVINVAVTINAAISVAISFSNTVIGTTPTIATQTCQELNDGLTQLQRQVIQRVNPIKSGSTVSFVTGDDGDLEKGRGVDFLTLDCNNEFGNTNRFTDSVGGQDYDGTGGSLVDYIIDHITGLGWKRTIPAAASWADQLSAADALTFATFSDWRVPNVSEQQSIRNYVSDSRYNYAPFSLSEPSNTQLWTSNTRVDVSTFAIASRTDRTADIIFSKTASHKTILCRNHY